MGAAIQKSSRTARTRSRPKRRNTPATMPITMGIGTASIARRTQPESPSASISTPVAMKAPITSAQLRCPSAGPTSTAPGIVQKNTSGCRYHQQNAMLTRPLRKNAPKIHDDRSEGERPPRVPTARMIATGPEAAKMNATRPLTKYTPPKSASERRDAGALKACARARRPSRCSGPASTRAAASSPPRASARPRMNAAHRLAVDPLAARQRLQLLVGVGKAVAAHHRLHRLGEHFPVGLQVVAACARRRPPASSGPSGRIPRRAGCGRARRRRCAAPSNRTGRAASATPAVSPRDGAAARWRCRDCPRNSRNRSD